MSVDYQSPAPRDPWERACWILIGVGYGILLLVVVVKRTGFLNTVWPLVGNCFLPLVGLGICCAAFGASLKARGQMGKLDYVRTILVIGMGILVVVLLWG